MSIKADPNALFRNVPMDEKNRGKEVLFNQFILNPDSLITSKVRANVLNRKPMLHSIKKPEHE